MCLGDTRRMSDELTHVRLLKDAAGGLDSRAGVLPTYLAFSLGRGAP
jgi:hypothetical protein